MGIAKLDEVSIFEEETGQNVSYSDIIEPGTVSVESQIDPQNFGYMPDSADVIEITPKEARDTARTKTILEDNNKNRAKLTPIFEGTLERKALAEALKTVMEERGLSIRKAANAAGVGPQDIQRAINGKATLDKGTSILQNLGCKIRFELTESSLG